MADAGWRRVSELFDQALERDEPERASWLERECGHEPDLLRQVRELLRSHGQAAGVLDKTVGGIAAAAVAEATEERRERERIDRYEVEREIGRGGMGVVYLASDPQLNRSVALKLLHPRATCDSQARERFLREARAASALDHPNIRTIYDIGETPRGELFMAMAYHEGETAADRLRREGAFPIEFAVEVTRQVADALDCAHRAGVIHRDIKPSNLLLTTSGPVKILDFGIARVLGAARLTQSGDMLGTPAYMAPEQLLGKPADERTDLWALGVALYEMITARTPFAGETGAVLRAIVHEEPAPLEVFRPEAPIRVLRVVRRLLRKDPAARFATGAEAAAALA